MESLATDGLQSIWRQKLTKKKKEEKESPISLSQTDVKMKTKFDVERNNLEKNISFYFLLPMMICLEDPTGES